jgi:hypothetical protein
MPTPEIVFSSETLVLTPSAVLSTTYTCPVGANWDPLAPGSEEIFKSPLLPLVTYVWT